MIGTTRLHYLLFLTVITVKNQFSFCQDNSTLNVPCAKICRSYNGSVGHRFAIDPDLCQSGMEVMESSDIGSAPTTYLPGFTETMYELKNPKTGQLLQAFGSSGKKIAEQMGSTELVHTFYVITKASDYVVQSYLMYNSKISPRNTLITSSGVEYDSLVNMGWITMATFYLFPSQNTDGICSIPQTTETNCTNTTESDFGLKCAQVSGYYLNGSCYQVAQPFGVDCRVINGSVPAVIRSTTLFTTLDTIFQTTSVNAVYLGAGNSDISRYNVFNKAKTAEGKQINVSISGSGNCIVVSLSDNVYTITDATDCTGTGLWICETGLTFEQRGCEQSLATTDCSVGSSISTQTINECSLQCASSTWCCGFNFQPVKTVCQLLSICTDTLSLLCNPGWFYYKRI